MHGLIFKAAFETMSAVGFREVLGKLNGVADPAIGACKCTGPQSCKTIDIYGRQTSVAIVLRNALDTELRGDPRGAGNGRLRGGAQAAVAEAELIDHGGGKRMRLADGQIDRVILEVPLAKSRVVTQADEIAGKVSMPPRIAYSAEKLITLAEILVGTNVEMVAVVGLAAIRRVIVENTRLISRGIEV